MKVLHLGSELSWRGGEQQNFYLMQELAGKVTSIMGCRAQSELERKCQDAGILTFNLGFRGLQISTARIIKNICETEQVDIIHCHSSRAHGAAFISAYMFGNKVPIIVSKRTDFPIKSSYLGKLKYNHIQIKKILCVSNKIKEIVQSSVDNPARVETVYSGVDPQKFNVAIDESFRQRYFLKDSDILIGNTSAIADHKDYFTFLDVAKEVCKTRQDVKFLIIGKGPLEAQIRDYCETLNLIDNVIFTGFLKNIPQILPQLDIFFMPSKEEGLGTSLLDAMCSNVPIVSTHAGGIPEIVKNGETGFCAPVKDVATLSKNILTLIEDKNLQKQFTANAFSMVTKEFTKTITAHKTFKIYEQVYKEWCI